ncbi:hypothetical protein AOQ84DRAFT_371699 [Glonium stellatum]|uniref:Uncharacterized protein n=1 Tax=Glonium stellatum TaxID=574774 RepID=A0A8E2FC98_9PEZI|nr:hypothetical protein AOQ84DRAFT_371699 [Glonium stellatum]
MSDYEESTTLLQQHLKDYLPGAPQHGSALMIRGEIACELYNHTNDMEDLAEAVFHMAKAFESMPPKGKANLEILQKVSILYERNHPMRVDFIIHHLAFMATSAASTHSMADIQDAIKQTNLLQHQVPILHAKRHFSGLFQWPVGHAIEVLREFDSTLLRKGIRQLDTSPLQDLNSSLAKFRDAPSESQMKTHVLENVYPYFCTAYQSKELMKGLITIQQENGGEISSMVKRLYSTDRLLEREDTIQLADNELNDRTKDPTAPNNPQKDSSNCRKTITTPFLTTAILSLMVTESCGT